MTNDELMKKVEHMVAHRRKVREAVRAERIRCRQDEAIQLLGEEFAPFVTADSDYAYVSIPFHAPIRVNDSGFYSAKRCHWHTEFADAMEQAGRIYRTSQQIKAWLFFTLFVVTAISLVAMVCFLVR